MNLNLFIYIQTEAERFPNGMPHAFIAAQFKQLGLDTYTHNFSIHYPLDETKVYCTCFTNLITTKQYLNSSFPTVLYW